MIKSIINELSDNSQSLVEPLLKTKILASRIGNENLLNWVNNELIGYYDIDENDIPSYRIAQAFTHCNIQKDYLVKRNTPFPISLLPEDFPKKRFLEFPLKDGIDTLENYQTDKEKDLLGIPLPIDLCSYVTSEVRKKDAELNITNIIVTTQVSSITQTLAEIRMIFLDSMLALEKEFPNLENEIEESQAGKEKISKQITIIMEQNNIKNNGNGSTINTGNSNQINSAAGNNIDQDILTPELKDEVGDLMTKIKTVLEEHEIEDKDDMVLEVQRIENQLKKVNPNKSIISQSLETVQSFLTSIAANAWTEPIL